MSAMNLPVVDQVAASMSARTLQQQVVASNIANRDAPGYQRLRLEFERAFEGTRPRVVADASAAPPSLEDDLVAMTANAGRYAALSRMLSRYFSIASAVAGGRS
jgi:flagellar basal body rod protein FlgB